MFRLIGTTVLVIGIMFFVFSVFLYWQKTSVNRIGFLPNFSETIVHTSGEIYPDRLKIDNISIDLPVAAVELKNNKWITNDYGLSYLVSTPLPGNVGNSVFYGHNWNSILGKLDLVQIGDIISLSYSESGEELKFRVNYIQIVEPSDISIIKQTTDTRITIYTCTGLFDSKRLVVTAIEV